MAKIDKAYTDLIEHIILREGFFYRDPTREDVGLLQVSSYQLDISMEEFPLLTCKRVAWKMVLTELLWMLSGSEDITYLQENNVHIWDKDVANFSPDGIYAGRIYGAQWRDWRGALKYHDNRVIVVDQIKKLLADMRERFFNRRLLVTAWQPAEMDQMALPPCHWAFEVLPEKDRGETCFTLKWHQRSVDTFLGLPFDIASYAFLGKLLEASTGIRFIRLIGDLSNIHIYDPHIPAVEELISRPIDIPPPGVRVHPGSNLETILEHPSLECFDISNYNPKPAIKAPLITQTSKP